MATSIAGGFTLLKQNLEITGLQSATVSTRQQRVREAIEKEMTVLSSFLAGSYQRSTMIAPLSDADIDIFIVLDPSYFEKYTAAALLDRVRTVLLKTYNTSTRISRNGQAVTLTFSDFKVDAVPCLQSEGRRLSDSQFDRRKLDINQPTRSRSPYNRAQQGPQRGHGAVDQDDTSLEQGD